MLNHIVLQGRMTKDPEIRYMPDGGQVAVINIATTEKWKDKNSGEVKERTDWHRVVLYRKLAEIAGQYLKKGNPVYIEGRLETKEYTDKHLMTAGHAVIWNTHFDIARGLLKRRRIKTRSGCW